MIILGNKKSLWFVFAVLILLGWLVLKLLKFNLGFYFTDQYVNEQLSNSWLRGDGWLKDNRYGDHLAFHNLFLLPFFGPLTMLLGVPGLYLGHLVLLLFGLIFYFKKTPADQWSGWLVLGVFLGPFAYWLWDNRPYGWHPELLYYPLTFLLAVALKSKAKLATIGAAIGILLVREDGILLLWAIYALFNWKEKGHGLFTKSQWAWAIFCVLVFVAGLSILTLNSSGNSRIAEALGYLTEDRALVALNLVQNAAGYLLLLIPFGAVLFWLKESKLFFLSLLLSLPLFAAAWISGLHYFPDTYHGVVWQPRISALWSVFLAALIFANKEAIKTPSWYIVLLLWISQFLLLLAVRDHNLVTMTTDIQKEFEVYKHDAHYPKIKALAKEIDQDKAVVVPYPYFHLFHKHKLIWPDFPENRLYEPDFVIARISDSSWHRYYVQGYDSILIAPDLLLKRKLTE